jgi:DNA-binding response OmpR family regulator
MKEALPRVIVVEDEPQIRHFVCDALKHEGCAANEAGSVRQGLDAAASGTPALVILDLGLPDGSGLEFIHDFRTWSRAPILILSARSAEQDKIEALDAVLATLLANAGKVATHRQLMREVWGPGHAQQGHYLRSLRRTGCARSSNPIPPSRNTS